MVFGVFDLIKDALSSAGDVVDVIREIGRALIEFFKTFEIVLDVFVMVKNILFDIAKGITKIPELLPEFFELFEDILGTIIDIIKELPDIIKEIPNILKELPGIIKEIPGIIKEIPDIITTIFDLFKNSIGLIELIPDMFEAGFKIAQFIFVDFFNFIMYLFKASGEIMEPFKDLFNFLMDFYQDNKGKFEVIFYLSPVYVSINMLLQVIKHI
jgi:phage-related protein